MQCNDVFCICKKKEAHKNTVTCVHFKWESVKLFKGPGGCREAAFSGDAHGAGDRNPESQTDNSRGPGEGTGGL